MKTLPELSQAIDLVYSENYQLDILFPLLVAYQGSDWQDYCHFDDGTYQRIPLYLSDTFEIRLLCWEQQQYSPIHDHPQQGCIMKVVFGHLQESIFNAQNLSPVKSRNYFVDEIAYIHDDIGYHSLGAPLKRAVSIHIYAPIQYEPNYFSQAVTNE